MVTTGKEGKNVAVFLEMAGVLADGKLSGPYAGAKSFIRAIDEHSQHNVTFFSTKVVDPELTDLVDRRNYFSMPDAEMQRLIDSFDAVHVLNGKDTALRVSQFTDKAMIGPNVIFGIPFRNINEVPAEVLATRKAYIEQEEAVCQRDWSYIITANPRIQSLYDVRLKGKHKAAIAMPFAVDTNLFHPDLSVERDEIVWIGGGPNRPSKGGALIEQVQTLLPDYNWVTLGKDSTFKYGEQIPHLQKAKVYVVTTAHETQGLATFEAMACGAPVIIANYLYDAHDGNGRKEQPPVYHLEGITSHIVARNPAAIAAAIEDLVNNPQAREELGRNAQRHVQEHFSLASMTAQYDALVERLVLEQAQGFDLQTKAKECRDRGELDQALEDYDLLTESDPHNVHNLYFRGTSHQAKGNYGQAEEDLEKAVAMAPGHSSARTALEKVKQQKNFGKLIAQAKELREQKDYLGCVDACSEILATNPQNSHARYFVATAFEAMGELELASEQYQLAGAGSSATAGYERVTQLLNDKGGKK